MLAKFQNGTFKPEKNQTKLQAMEAMTKSFKVKNKANKIEGNCDEFVNNLKDEPEASV